MFIGSKPAAHMRLDVRLQFGRGPVTWGENDERLDDGAACFVRDAYHRGIGNGWVLYQTVLDFRRTDAIAGALEYIVGTSRYQRYPSPSCVARSPVRHQSPMNFFAVASGLRQYSRKNTGSRLPSGA